MGNWQLKHVAGDKESMYKFHRTLRIGPQQTITVSAWIQNSLARTVVKAPKSCHITPILCSLHWFRITERIEYKLLSLMYKVLTTTQPSYLHNLISIQRPRSTRSSSIVTLARPQTSSSLKITHRSLLCLTLSRESATFISSSTSFWYQFFNFRLT